jgi:hypothetical protein
LLFKEVVTGKATAKKAAAVKNLVDAPLIGFSS